MSRGRPEDPEPSAGRRTAPPRDPADPQTIALGYHPVREILRARPQEVERVALSRRDDARRREIEALCRRHRVRCASAPPRSLDALAGGAPHNGVVAWLRPAGVRPLAGDPELLVLLEDVQDPRNLGAVLRVCEAAGVGRVLLRDRGCAPLSAVAERAAAGATAHLPCERVVNSGRTLEELKGDGFWVYGAAVGGRPPWEVSLTGRVAFCLGGEERGLRRRTRELCDELLGLPMMGQVASLNVATAAAALLFEAVRQRSSR